MMKLLYSGLGMIMMLALVGCGANKGIEHYNINQAYESMPGDVKTQLGDFKFYFDKMPSGAKKLGYVQTSRRTNASFKDAKNPCQWVFYSALIALKEHAKELSPQANGVAEIKSNWKGKETASEETFVCASGFVMAGVALQGVAIKE